MTIHQIFLPLKLVACIAVLHHPILVFFAMHILVVQHPLDVMLRSLQNSFPTSSSLWDHIHPAKPHPTPCFLGGSHWIFFLIACASDAAKVALDNACVGARLLAFWHLMLLVPSKGLGETQEACIFIRRICSWRLGRLILWSPSWTWFWKKMTARQTRAIHLCEMTSRKS